MPSRVVAYGFLGRFSGDVKRYSYHMPLRSRGPWEFRLYGLVLWPDVYSEGNLLLSLRVSHRDSEWKELLPTALPLARYAPSPHRSFEEALSTVTPKIQCSTGRFHTFLGDTPIGWQFFTNTPEVTTELQAAPAGAVTVKWDGALRGLLLLGTQA